MSWLADNPLAVAGLWAAMAGLAFWLYLHSREPLRRRVATLRFWNSVQSASQPRRRRIREPWALAAQVLFLLFLAMALSNPRWGITAKGRSVVLVLDNSIWSQTKPTSGSPWIDDVHGEAESLVNALPPGDQVLLISADPNAPPILPFTTDKAALRRAILATQPTSTLADVSGTLQLGQAALTGADRGLLVYIGPGMMDARQAQDFDRVRTDIASANSRGKKMQFLVRQVGGHIENRGITRIDVQRDAVQPDRWHLLTQVKNYGDAATQLNVKLSLRGQPFVQRSIRLGAGELANVENDFQWSQGGLLEAEISPSDALEADDKASVVLPAFHPIRVAVAAANIAFAEEALKVFGTDPYLRIDIEPAGTIGNDKPDVAIYQSANVPAQPRGNSIYFLGGASSPNSPLVRVTNWNLEHPAAQWVRSRDVTVRNPMTIAVQTGDSILATGGNPPRPLVVAREAGGYRSVIVGFNPTDSNFESQPAFPLLIAGSIEWMTHSVDETIHSYTSGKIDVASPATQVVAPSGENVSFARNGANVQLLADELGVYRIVEKGGETDFSVNAPVLPSQRLAPNASEAAAPEGEALIEVAQSMWRWLVVFALIATCLEWWLYFRSTRKRQLSEDRGAYTFPDSPVTSAQLATDRNPEGNRAASLTHRGSA